MSLLTKGSGLAKKFKHRFQDTLHARTPVYLSPVRRIERVATTERLCAMTFGDGPCRLPANPDRFGGNPLALVLAGKLERYNAKGTFDVVGDTSANYPDKAGKHGSASWSGIAYDHYPDFGKDADGAAAKRLLESSWCVAYRDNTLHADAPLTRGELAMMGYGWDAVAEHVAMRKMGKAPFRDLSRRHPYAAAAKHAVHAGALTAQGGRFRPNAPVTAAELQQFCHVRLGVLPDLGAISKPDASNRSTVACFTHGEYVRLLTSLLPLT